jgi:predicted lipid-binding transport protein (Tim44 family)
VLAVATVAGGETAPARRTPGTPAQRQVTPGPSEDASRTHPGAATGQTSPAAATVVSDSARKWWITLMATLAGGLAFVAVMARRRSRESTQAPTYADGWQGIGGPSYAPRPVTVRVEPRTGRHDTQRVGNRSDASPRPENLRRPFGVPADFDAPEFLANARQSFVRLQSAWDRSDLHELDECTTDEMFNALTHELRVRAGPSRTEVLELTASLLGIETAAGEYRASVRFSGNLKVNGEDERLDEVWNLSRPVDGSGGGLLAGIQQLN